MLARRRRGILTLTFLFSSVASLGLATRHRAHAQEAPVPLAVDFSRSLGPVRTVANGFLIHGVPPPEEYVAPLKPYLWRVGVVDPVVYASAVAVGAKVQIVVSDTWGYPNALYGWPYHDWQAWENHVRAQAARAQRFGMTVQWDVWNEPDLPEFWAGTWEQWLQTYVIAYRALREVDPAAIVGGPSVSTPSDVGSLRAFLDFCLASGCEVNFLSWHEFESPQIASIPTRIATARAVAQDPLYTPVRVREIQINEVTGADVEYSPGHVIVAFHYLEQGGADAAVKSCWSASDGTSNCWNGSLDGLLVPETYQRRAVAWAYWAYAQRAGLRFETSSGDPAIAVMASAQPERGLILVGYSGPASSSSGSRNAALAIRGLGVRSDVAMRAYYLPNSGTAPLAAPVQVFSGRLLVTGGVLTTEINGLVPDVALLIVLEP